MIKSELIKRLTDQNPICIRAIWKRIVDTMLEAIVAALAHGDRVELRGFGVSPSGADGRGSAAILGAAWSWLSKRRAIRSFS
jgi:hypothetical protein